MSKLRGELAGDEGPPPQEPRYLTLAQYVQTSQPEKESMHPILDDRCKPVAEAVRYTCRHFPSIINSKTRRYLIEIC